MTITKEQQYASPLSIVVIILISYITLAVFILWQLFNRIIELYSPENISFKNGYFILQPEGQHISILELYTLNDFVYHFFIPIGIISVYALVRKWNFKLFFGFNNFHRSQNWIYFISAVIIIIGINLIMPPPEVEAVKFFNRIAQGQSIVQLIIIVGILIPIIEEIIFRRLLYDLFNFSIPKASPWLGIILSSLIFALLHYQYQEVAMIGTLAVSMILSFGRYYTNGIVIPILIHIVVNSIGCFMIM